MEERGLRLGDLCALILRKWRILVLTGIIAAVVLGLGTIAYYLLNMNNPDKQEQWQTEYESEYSAYWAEVNAVEHEINETKHAIKLAEDQLALLDWAEDDYLLEIEKREADVESYEQQIEYLERNIEELQEEKAEQEYLLKWRTEQNENSLYMKIDPYDVQTAEAYVRVDTGYQIITGSTYQDTDRTEEVLQRYRLLVNSADFYDRMITDLGLNTEVRYLTEVLSVSQYGENSLRVNVIGTNAAQLTKMVEYICNTMLENHDAVGESVEEHTIEVYGQRNYSVVNMGVFTTQQNNLQLAQNIESFIRELEQNILDVQAQIREMKTEIRVFKKEIRETENAILDLPQRKSAMNDEILAHEDAVVQLTVERMGLLEEPEPQYESPASRMVSGFIKFAIVGGIVGVLLAAVWLVMNKLAGSKVLSAQSMTDTFGVAYFGVWPEEEGKKRPFAFVDRWMDKLTNAAKGDKKLVSANIASSSQGYSKILLCGGADKDRIQAIAEEVGVACPGVQIAAAGSVVNDAEAVEGLSDCDAVILVEEIYESDLNTIQQVVDRAKTLNKHLLGVVIA